VALPSLFPSRNPSVFGSIWLPLVGGNVSWKPNKKLTWRGQQEQRVLAKDDDDDEDDDDDDDDNDDGNDEASIYVDAIGRWGLLGAWQHRAWSIDHSEIGKFVTLQPSRLCLNLHKAHTAHPHVGPNLALIARRLSRLTRTHKDSQDWKLFN